MYLAQIDGNEPEEKTLQPAELIAQELSPLEVLGPEILPLEKWMLGPMVGRSPVMQHLFSRMRCTAPHFRVASVEGEAGSGKMLAARTLHQIGPSSEGPFSPYIAAEFLDNPYVLWKECRNGMLYLARVDELAPEKQRALRDFLEHAAHERMRTHGASGPLQLVSGALQPLRQMAASGAFRSDLAAHLTAIRFLLPPLREHREDIPALSGLFLRQWSQMHQKPLRGFAPGTLTRLAAYPWPGNVGELESTIAAAALECSGQWIRPIDVPRLQWPAVAPPPVTPPLADDPNLDRAILRHITQVLARANGNKVRAARMLGISRSTLYRVLDGARSGAVPAGGIPESLD